MAHLRACAQWHSERRVCFHGAPQGVRTAALRRKGVLSWRTSGHAHSGTQKKGCAFMAHLRACAQWHSKGRVCFHGAPQGLRTVALRRKGVLSWRTSGRAHSDTQKEGCAFMAHLRACAQRHSEGRVCFHGAPQGLRTAALRRKGVLSWRTSGRAAHAGPAGPQPVDAGLQDHTTSQRALPHPRVPLLMRTAQVLEEEVAALRAELKDAHEVAARASTTWDSFRKERDFHRMHHKRVAQEKNKLITDIKRLKVGLVGRQGGEACGAEVHRRAHARVLACFPPCYLAYVPGWTQASAHACKHVQSRALCIGRSAGWARDASSCATSRCLLMCHSACRLGRVQPQCVCRGPVYTRQPGALAAQDHFAKYEPTILELKRKYETAMKEKMLVSLERDKLAARLDSEARCVRACAHTCVCSYKHVPLPVCTIARIVRSQAVLARCLLPHPAHPPHACTQGRAVDHRAIPPGHHRRLSIAGHYARRWREGRAGQRRGRGGQHWPRHAGLVATGWHCGGRWVARRRARHDFRYSGHGWLEGHEPQQERLGSDHGAAAAPSVRRRGVCAGQPQGDVAAEDVQGAPAAGGQHGAAPHQAHPRHRQR